MIKKNRSLIFLIVFVLTLLLIPQKRADQLRIWVISGITPTWKMADHSVEGLEKLHQLELENQMLKEQLKRAFAWVESEQKLHFEWNQFVHLSEKSENPFFARRADYLKNILDKELHSLPAKVIFREPSSWTSSVWVDVGTDDNRKLGREIVAENSPVVVGKCVVGVIEKVAEKRSRVRLLTDPALNLSVRVVRGGEQNRILYEHLTQLVDLLKGREDLASANELRNVLLAFSNQLETDARGEYLAKGILCGSRTPKWRICGSNLNGTGFNYDFPDTEGEARILRTGETLSGERRSPLIQVGDLLVTTGLDGVFPADLNVACVTKILKLHEGGTSYSLEAKPLITDLNALKEVFVLPP